MSSSRLLSQIQYMHIVYIHISLAEDAAVCCTFNLNDYEHIECII